MTKHNAVVTGASGFIGSELVRLLVRNGYFVTIIPHSEFDFYYDLIRQIPKDTEYIFHLSSYGNMSFQDNEFETIKSNITNLQFMLDITKDIKYKAFINFSSSAVGLKHQTYYSATKMAGEYLVRAFVDKYKKPVVSVRPFSVYGEGEADFRFIPHVIKCLVRDEILTLSPDASHDWIYLDDLITAVVRTAEGLKFGILKPGETFDIGTGKQYTNLAIVSILNEIVGKYPKVKIDYKMREFDQKQWVTAVNNLQAVGWKPDTSIERGLLKCYGYYKQRFKKTGN